MRNDRKVQMPPHCGNCIFLEWAEDYSHCTHPSIVDNDDIIDRIQSEETTDNSWGIADNILDDAICDQDWQQYDQVCDHHRIRECHSYPDRAQEETKARNEAKQKFADRVLGLIEKQIECSAKRVEGEES